MLVVVLLVCEFQVSMSFYIEFPLRQKANEHLQVWIMGYCNCRFALFANPGSPTPAESDLESNRVHT